MCSWNRGVRNDHSQNKLYDKGVPMKKPHRLNLRIDSRTYEQLKGYAEKNTFQQLSEGVRKLLKEALSSKAA